MKLNQIKIKELVRKISTPFFLFSEKKIEENFKNFKGSFGKFYQKIRIDYSVKTNYELAILKILNGLGSDFEISGGHELFMLIKAGVQPQKVIFDGPAKKDEEIEFALKEGIHAFYADSFEDLKRISSVARRLRKNAKIAIRVNLINSFGIFNYAEKFMQRFGIKEKELLTLIPHDFRNLEIVGLSTNIGSQIVSPFPYIKAIERLSYLSFELKKRACEISEINLGGGFPSPTLSKTKLANLALPFFGVRVKERVPTIPELGTKISKKISQAIQKLKSNPTLAFQPGRSIISNTAVLVSKVMAVKKNWIILDAGTSILPESLLFAQRRIIFLDKKGGFLKLNVSGPSLSSGDVLSLNLISSIPQVGDIAVILDAGAYSLTRASHFTGPLPAVYLIEKNEKIELIRRKESYQDLIRGMRNA